MSADPHAVYRDQARALVVAEIEDVLTRTDRGEPGPQYRDAARVVATSRPRPQHQLSVLVEAAAIAGEAVIRLAAARGEDPRATWEWLLSTPWTGAEHDPQDT